LLYWGLQRRSSCRTTRCVWGSRPQGPDQQFLELLQGARRVPHVREFRSCVGAPDALQNVCGRQGSFCPAIGFDVHCNQNIRQADGTLGRCRLPFWRAPLPDRPINKGGGQPLQLTQWGAHCDPGKASRGGWAGKTRLITQNKNILGGGLTPFCYTPPSG
jgi:hypothetical protein